MRRFQLKVRRFKILAKLLVLSATSTLLLVSSLATSADELPFYNSPEFTPHWLHAKSPALDSFHRIPAFEFTNQEGAVISEATVKDKIYVASFFFSTCPGICPAIRSKLAKVQERFSDDDNLLILSHSIRPATDTPEVLKAYAEQNDVQSETWHLLTGQAESIYELARNAYFANEDLGNIQDLNDFLHTENLLLIDQNRYIRGVYNGLSRASVANLITDINNLLKK